MRAGELRHFIRIEVPVRTKGKFSNVEETWNLYREVWAKIETLRGFDESTASATWPTATNKITMRYISGMLPTMRVVYEGVIYSILNVNDLELRHIEIELTCESGASAS